VFLAVRTVFGVLVIVGGVMGVYIFRQQRSASAKSDPVDYPIDPDHGHEMWEIGSESIADHALEFESAIRLLASSQDVESGPTVEGSADMYDESPLIAHLFSDVDKHWE
jgi:hypothetical protein